MSQPDGNTDLELITTEVLIEELVGRFDHAVFCGLKVQHQKQVLIHRKFSGNPWTCSGLAQSMSLKAIDDLEASFELPDGDEARGEAEGEDGDEP